MIFTIPVTTRVEDFDQRGLLTPTALLSIFENTAVRHAETVGYSPMNDSLRNGMAWVITNWRVEMDRAPAYDEPFTASTWLCNNPRQATREMLLHSAGGEVLARGQAKLALVDRSSNKPCLPTPDRLAAYQPEQRTAFTDRLPRLSSMGSTGRPAADSSWLVRARARQAVRAMVPIEMFIPFSFLIPVVPSCAPGR